MKRFNPNTNKISYSDTGSWSWDSNIMKQSDDGDYVRYDDVKELIQTLVDAISKEDHICLNNCIGGGIPRYKR